MIAAPRRLIEFYEKAGLLLRVAATGAPAETDHSYGSQVTTGGAVGASRPDGAHQFRVRISPFAANPNAFCGLR